MVTGLLILHVVVCILLCIVVLLQFGKGAEAGAMMGGGGSSSNIFTSSAKGNFFTKMTTFLAILFMANSIALSVMKGKDSKKSVFDNMAPIAKPLNSDAKKADKVDAKAPTKKEEKKK